MNESTSWNQMILKTHFQSLNPKWNDQESVVTLLHEIARRMENPSSLTDEERSEYVKRIQVFIQSPEVRKRPLPMKSVERKQSEDKSAQTGS